MTPLELLQTLRALDIHLTLMPDGEHFHGSAPAGVLTDALLAAIRQHKHALLAIHESYDERASLLEYDAGMARAEAEREAWKYIEARCGTDGRESLVGLEGQEGQEGHAVSGASFPREEFKA